MSRDVVIVIPCYQGARKVGAVVRGARASGLAVVVVDDGSSDDSARVAAEAGATVLRHAGNRGKGAALATGFAWAAARGAAAVLTMDADGQHDPAEIGALIAAHREAPDAVVIGVRSFAPEDMPRRSRIGNRISTWWISRFAGRRYSDTQSGFRVYPRALYQGLVLRSRRFDTETELLLRAAKRSLPVVEVPIRTIYDDDRVTHFHGFRDTMRVITLVLGSPFWLVVGMLAVAPAGCAHAPTAPTAMTTAAVLPNEPTWRTMRAEHQVAIDVTLDSGAHDRRQLRALVAVERPDRFRLRALGPAGLTLFDVVSIAGQVKVVESLRDPHAPALGRVIESMAGDLQAAFDLTPRPRDRTVAREGDGVVIREPGRVVRADARHIAVENHILRYRVEVTVRAVEVNVPLDPALFAQ